MCEQGCCLFMFMFDNFAGKRAQQNGTEVHNSSTAAEQLENSSAAWTQHENSSAAWALLEKSLAAWAQLENSSAAWAQLESGSAAWAQVENSSEDSTELENGSVAWTEFQRSSAAAGDSLETGAHNNQFQRSSAAAGDSLETGAHNNFHSVTDGGVHATHLSSPLFSQTHLTSSAANQNYPLASSAYPTARRLISPASGQTSPAAAVLTFMATGLASPSAGQTTPAADLTFSSVDLTPQASVETAATFVWPFPAAGVTRTGDQEGDFNTVETQPRDAEASPSDPYKGHHTDSPLPETRNQDRATLFSKFSSISWSGMPLSGRGQHTAAEIAPVLSNFSGTESQTNRPGPDDVISVRKENNSAVHSHPDYTDTVNGSPPVAGDSVKNTESAPESNTSTESAPESNTSCAHFRRTDYSK
jgi:hypothetical protein